MEEKTITLAEIIKMLLNEGKKILCFTLIAVIIAGALGAILAPGKTYGAELDFYVSSATVDDRMLSLLSSKLFTEKLLLDSNGLTGDRSSKEYITALAAKKAYEAKVLEKEKLTEQLETIPLEESEALSVFKAKESTFYAIRETYLLLESSASAEVKADLLRQMDEAQASMQEAQALHATKSAELKEARNTIRTIEFDINMLKEDMNVKYDIALASWRQSKEAKKQMDMLLDSISYDSNNSFIEVEVAIKGDDVFAESVVDHIISILPDFVVENVTPLPETDATPDCQLADTIYEVEEINKFNRILGAVKYGLIAGACVFILSCFAVVGIALLKMSFEQEKEAALPEGNPDNEKEESSEE